MRPLPATPRRRQDGFTLAEMMVTVFVLVLLVLVLLALFDFTNRVSRTQTQIAGMQQAQRVAQHEMVRLVRMAGRGGLAAESAFELRNDRPADEPILAAAGASTPRVRAGSDVVVVRGVFSSEIYQLDARDAFSYDAASGRGRLTVRATAPSGLPQDLGDLEGLLAADGDGVPETLLLVSAVDGAHYAVVELDPSYDGRDEGSVTLRFVTGGARAAAHRALSTAALDAPTMRSLAYAGILEEYRFYVRDVAAAGVGSPRAGELVRARVDPGTEHAYRGDASYLTVTVADDVLDLQVALGFDADGDGTIEEGRTVGERQVDEWRFNVAADAPPGDAFGMVRLTTLVRTARPDPYFEAPRLADVEDHSYDGTVLNDDPVERRYRRWPLQTLVELRNLG